jgi:hypothetical protein
MKKFGQSTNHIFVGDGAGRSMTPFQAQTIHNRKLSTLFPNLFHKISIDSSSTLKEPGEEKIFIGEPLLRYVMVPRSHRGWTDIPFVRETSVEADIAAFVENFRQSSQAAAILSSISEMNISESICKGECIVDGTIDQGIVDNYK